MSRARTWRSNTEWLDNQIIGRRRWAAELVRRDVAVIAAACAQLGASRPRRQPRRPPSSSSSPEDQVRLGLVAGLARPGGNLTGCDFLSLVVAGETARARA